MNHYRYHESCDFLSILSEDSCTSVFFSFFWTILFFHHSTLWPLSSPFLLISVFLLHICSLFPYWKYALKNEMLTSKENCHNKIPCCELWSKHSQSAKSYFQEKLQIWTDEHFMRREVNGTMNKHTKIRF